MLQYIAVKTLIWMISSHFTLKYVAVCCSVMQRIAACCSVMQQKLGIRHPSKKEEYLRGLSENPGQALTFKCLKNDKITHERDCAP